MVAIISLFVVVFMSILVTRIATIALTHTGMPRDTAKFQARSAFTGAGFTTAESEMVVNHPVRRKIVLTLILIGNAGIVAAMSSLILTFVSRGEPGGFVLKIVLLIAGMVGLWGLASSRWVDRRLSRYMDKILRRYTDLGVRDYDSLLHLAGEYRLAELEVQPQDWLDGQTLAEARPRSEGINVLGIKKPDGTYIGNPGGDTRVFERDALIVYGRVSAIEELDRRRKGHRGDREHREAVIEQRQVVVEEQQTTEILAATSRPGSDDQKADHRKTER